MAVKRTLWALAALPAVVCLLSAGTARAEAGGRGEQLFTLCGTCHGEAGGGNAAYLAPAIAGQGAWYVKAQLEKFRAGIRGGHPDDLGGMRMRPMSMWLGGDEDIETVAAYVESLPPARPAPSLAGGNAANGEKIFALCTACHLADGQGNQQLNAPSLLHASDWYLYTQLANFKAGIRGGRPDDTTGLLMRPMAMSLVTDQAMRDVIAYIMTLGEQSP